MEALDFDDDEARGSPPTPPPAQQFPFFINPGVAFVPRSVADARPPSREGTREGGRVTEVEDDDDSLRFRRDGDLIIVDGRRSRSEGTPTAAAAIRARDAATATAAARDLSAKRQKTFDSRGKRLDATSAP